MIHQALRTQIIAVVAAAIGVACTSAQRPATSPVSSRPCASATVTTAAELDELAGCRSIAGDLRIEGSDLESLEGLEGLETVTGKLRITGNPALYTTRGLGGLQSVGTLDIMANDRLISLGGLDALKHAHSVRIVDNPRLARALGFLGALEPVTGRVVIKRNAGLSRHEVQGEVERLRGVGSRIATR